MIILAEILASVLGAAWGLILGLRRYPVDLMETLPGRLPDVFLKQVLFLTAAVTLGCNLLFSSVILMFIAMFSGWLAVAALALTAMLAIVSFFIAGNRLAYLVRL